MNIAEKPIAAIIGRLTSTGDGIHMIAQRLQEGLPDRHPHAPRGAAGLCGQRHDAGDDAERPLAGAAGPRGLGACAVGTCDRRARRYRDADALFRTRLAAARSAQPQPRRRIRGPGIAAAAPDDSRPVRRSRRPGTNRAAAAAGDDGIGPGGGFRDLHPAAARAALPARRRHRAGGPDRRP